MKNALSTIKENWAWRFFSARAKCLVVLGVFTVSLQIVNAQSVESPRGAEVFDNARRTAISALPPEKKIRLSWNFPLERQTPDLVFKVYHSTNLSIPLRLWAALTNIPGTLRSVEILADKSQEFYIVTASNYLGESDYATR